MAAELKDELEPRNMNTTRIVSLPGIHVFPHKIMLPSSTAATVAAAMNIYRAPRVYTPVTRAVYVY